MNTGTATWRLAEIPLEKLAAVSDRALPYEFVVLNSSVPNAWALPGGKVFLLRGLHRRGELAQLRVALHLPEQLVGIGLVPLDLDEAGGRLQGIAAPLPIAGEQRHHVADEVDLALLGPGVEHRLRHEEETCRHGLSFPSVSEGFKG